MRTDLPLGRVTLLLTDIEGSTRLLQQLGAEGYARAQAEHREILRAAFASEGGVEVDTQGDAFFYAFPSAGACVRAAVAGTRALAVYPWTHGQPVRVRMGMHSGEAQPTEEGYVGVTVNKTARIASLGHGGQILLSAETAADTLAAEPGKGVWGEGEGALRLRDLGEHRLKDFDGVHRLHQIVIPELPADFPPLRSAKSRPNNLPVPLTPFVGRSEIVTHVRDLVCEPAVRVVTLLGPGGTGKTRLGVRVADELLHRFEDGAFFVGLATLVDPAQVIAEIARTLGIKETAHGSRLDGVCAGIGDSRLLLVLDNFEQVQKAARDIGALLSRCAGLKVIATSRQPLRLSGERVFRIPPLALPKPGAGLTLAECAQFEAVRLFVERAKAARLDFELDEGNYADVVEICRKIDALPFAIELAAARLQSMDPAKLRRALDRRLKVLTGGTAEMLDHQRTLKDLINWSYELLEDAERTLWQRLAIFSGGCTFEAAEFVCNADDAYLLDVDIDELAGKSLLNIEFASGSSVEKVVAGEAAERRIVMLETLREFAREKLAESGELEALAERHGRWFQDQSERAEREMRGPLLKAWLSILDREQGNLRAALEFLLTHADGVERARALAGALWFYWYERGLFSEGEGWLERALACGARTPSLALARAELGLANLLRHLNRMEAAVSHCEAALEAFKALGDAGGMADTECQLGILELHLGHFDTAEPLISSGIETLRRVGNRGRLAFSLVALGSIRQLRGELDGAAAFYEESLGLGRALKDANYTATALVNLGEVMQLLGRGGEAADHVREALDIYQELNVRNAIAYTIEILAGIDLEAGRADEAVGLFAAAAALREQLGTPIETFNLARYERDLDAARRALGDARFEAAWTEGARRPLAESIALAKVDHAPVASAKIA